MKEDEKVSHLMKGVAEDIYQALLTREINDTARFIKWCNYIEYMKQKRVGRPKLERLPNVVPVASLTDETDLVSLIRTIVREEVHRLVNQTQESLDSDPQSLEEIVQDEVERKNRCGERRQQTCLFPTAGRPGHVMHFTAERKAVFDNSETADGTSTTLALKKKIRRPNSSRRFTPSPTRGRSPIRRYRSSSPYRRSSRQAVGARKTKESDLPRRVSLTERRIIHEKVQKMLDEGIVQPSESPWSSPVVLSLLKSGVGFHWGPEEVEAFNSLKKALTSDPVLGMYDERASTEIHTDASGYGIGAVIVQIQNNVEKVIAYASRTLTKPKRIIPPQKGECLAIVWATNKFRPLARWALRLQEHDFDVKYKTGKKHCDADALSRNPVEEETETPDKFLAVTTTEVAEIAEFLLEEIVLRHGAPRVIITDRGAVFRSRLVSLSSTCVTLIIVSQRRIIPKQMD
ncbi:transposon Ty3-I Gag-Pol polyprotein [Trichonephila clavipes]|nr:transposon Ty3-I Gag-Pol polyprotein [Trichonephila clavipes]